MAKGFFVLLDFHDCTLLTTKNPSIFIHKSLIRTLDTVWRKETFSSNSEVFRGCATTNELCAGQQTFPTSDGKRDCFFRLLEGREGEPINEKREREMALDSVLLPFNPGFTKTEAPTMLEQMLAPKKACLVISSTRMVFPHPQPIITASIFFPTVAFPPVSGTKNEGGEKENLLGSSKQQCPCSYALL